MSEVLGWIDRHRMLTGFLGGIGASVCGVAFYHYLIKPEFRKIQESIVEHQAMRMIEKLDVYKLENLKKTVEEAVTKGLESYRSEVEDLKEIVQDLQKKVYKG